MRSFLVVLVLMVMTIAVFIAAKLPEVSSPENFYQPEMIVYGIDADTLNEMLLEKCALKWIREIDPPFLSKVKKAQKQLDCLGFPFYGKRRFAEFVIADNSLEAVWILTTKEEEAAISAAMTKAYGSPDKVGKTIEIYSGAGAALRKDKPEVVFFSKSSAYYIEGLFKKHD